MTIKNLWLLIKWLNIILNFLFDINFFTLYFMGMDYFTNFTNINEFKIKKGIEIEDSPLKKQDKTQIKILLVFFSSMFIATSVTIFLIKIKG